MREDLLPEIVGDGNVAHEARPVLIVGPDGNPVVGGDPLDVAAERAAAYSSGTGTRVVATGERLKVRLFNPVGSGKVLVVRYRAFGNNRQGNDALLERVFLVNPNALTGEIISSANPLNSDPTNPGSPAVGQMSFAISADDIAAGNLGSPMPLNGLIAEVFVPRFVYPGQSFGYQIDGAGGGTLQGSEARASVTFAWEERDIV